jgi:methylenetetrahydrofolate reductase (NADPH)
MRVSVELIPRGEAELLADARAVRAAMPRASAFNIPDLMRFPLGSWKACKVTSSILPASIPHIRAIDLPPGDDLPMLEAMLAAGLVKVLVIRGDPPHDMETVQNLGGLPAISLGGPTRWSTEKAG